MLFIFKMKYALWIERLFELSRYFYSGKRAAKARRELFSEAERPTSFNLTLKDKAFQSNFIHLP